MDITIILGLLAGLAALIGGFLWEGGQLGGLLQGNAALIVFGGTAAAVVISFPASRLRTIPAALRFAFGRRSRSPLQLIEDVVDMATLARRTGVLALEEAAAEHPDPFLREGMGMIVDGTDGDAVRQILELEMDATEQKHEGYAKIFEAAGGYAPTMGIIGTVMGLVHVLGGLQDPTQLGPSIAVAFTATLYGVASANIIFLPIASKIKARSEEEIQNMELLLEGILAVQQGQHPLLVRKKLNTYTLENSFSAATPTTRGTAHETAD
ncbi:MotA/TolQ/ExbB proton channel [Paenibacillus algicola]|uniref:MotA/TolQ/ExbB proton channel n=1 Tax=Paenibacillus algicola TaxID=2565926 RepID=A0A4P8XPE2_9BACL|nr:flagellar motor protein [Paenibacillus algicola]QCT04518.1 MotA/TolQ/ExbB proton channel [Paenibacillus algicola]